MIIFPFLVNYMFGLTSLIFSAKHILLMLLSLEFMVVSVFIFMFYVMVNTCSVLYILLYFLVMVVCESALGLSLLVSVTRAYGNDMIFAFLSC